MSFLFSKSFEALRYAEETRTYGVFYEEATFDSSDIYLHNCCEVILCLTGSGVCLADSKIYNANSGDMFIFNQFEPHLITKSKNEALAKFGAFIHPDYIKERSTVSSDLSACFFGDGTNKISLKDNEIAKLEELFVFFRKDTGFADDITKNAAIDCLLILVHKYFEKFSVSSKTDEPISQILSYIDTHLSDNLSLENISEYFSISVNQLCKIFKESLGTTVLKYISAKRVSMAKKLLSNGKSVSETAKESGFSDYTNFIRVFKKLTGTPPGKYGRL